MLRIIADNEIPFLKGVLEPFAKITYLPGKQITRDVAMDADALLIRTRTKCTRSLLKGTKIKCFVSPGNDDSFFIDKVLAESNTIFNPEGRVIDIDGIHEMASTGYTNMTPWKCPRDIPDEELMKRIDDLTGKLKNPSRSIFNFHCPPYDTTIDSAPQLDENMKPKLSAAGPIMAPAGSKAVRSAIETLQPLLGLHGHIHESKGYLSLGRTICVNPGSEYTEGVLRGFLAELTEEKVKDFLFVSA